MLRKEDQARLVRRDDKLDGVEVLAALLLFISALAFFTTITFCGFLRAGLRTGGMRTLTLLRDLIHSDIFNVGSSKAVHNFVIGISLLPEEAKLVALEHHPVLLVAFGLCF